MCVRVRVYPAGVGEGCAYRGRVLLEILSQPGGGKPDEPVGTSLPVPVACTGWCVPARACSVSPLVCRCPCM